MVEEVPVSPTLWISISQRLGRQVNRSRVTISPLPDCSTRSHPPSLSLDLGDRDAPHGGGEDELSRRRAIKTGEAIENEQRNEVLTILRSDSEMLEIWTSEEGGGGQFVKQAIVHGRVGATGGERGGSGEKAGHGNSFSCVKYDSVETTYR